MLFNRSRFLTEEQINQQQKKSPSEQQLGICFPQNVIKWREVWCGIIKRLFCCRYATNGAIQQVKIFNWTANKSTTKKNALRATARDLFPSKCYQMKGSLMRYNKTYSEQILEPSQVFEAHTILKAHIENLIILFHIVLLYVCIHSTLLESGY
jgi:hypothetical protein